MSEYIVVAVNEPTEKQLEKWGSKRLVRCKDCGYSMNDYGLVNAILCINRKSPCHAHIVDGSFYCACGEQKGEENSI